MGFLKKLFSSKKPVAPIAESEFSQEEYDKHYEEKVKGIESVVGKMHGLVGHAIIPFQMGGTVDMYYFTNHIPGTGFATMELLDPNGNGPKPNHLGTYELIAFTKELYNEKVETPSSFGLIERRICGIFTAIGNYCIQAVLNPYETCEVPSERGPNKCLIFDNYQPGDKEFKIGDKKHHLLLCVEIFKREMEFARQNGSVGLIQLLRQKGFYPYSDLDREPVV